MKLIDDFSLLLIKLIVRISSANTEVNVGGGILRNLGWELGGGGFEDEEDKRYRNWWGERGEEVELNNFEGEEEEGIWKNKGRGKGRILSKEEEEAGDKVKRERREWRK